MEDPFLQIQSHMFYESTCILCMQEEFVDEPHDGVWAGEEYYGCEASRGMFVLLSGLHPDKRDKFTGNPSLTSKYAYLVLVHS